MTQTVKILDYDIIYLSYDEPNAEKNYADLLAKVPWAKRVHGVKGSDEAHKACARLSETDRFVTVDGDNIVREDFLNQEVDFEEHKDLSKCVISWAGYNVVNGLMYGNGGLKLWPKQYVLEMKTHENAPADDVYGPGILAMARQGGNGASMGSQFFIVYSESEIPSDAAGGYTVFGKLTKGLGSISNIAEDGTADGGTDGPPKNKVLLTAISVK